MRDLIEHAESRLMLDFAEDDFGGPRQAEVVRAWKERGHAERGEFICDVHRDYEKPWLYLQQRGGSLVAAHWPGTGQPEHRITHGTSDEHKRQVEYLQRAGEAAGFRVGTEVTLPTRVRSDAVIYGPVTDMGIEVQRSALTASAAKARTTKARRAGVEPVWFADSEAVPRWNWQVPSVRMNPQTLWDTLPTRRSVTVASGVRDLIEILCTDIPGDQNGCPKRRYRCTDWHAIHAPKMGLVVDDLAAMFPAGGLVPMRYRTFTRGDLVLIVTPGDKAWYEDFIGKSADVPLKAAKPRMLQPGRVECAAPASVVGPFTPGEVHPDTGACGGHSYWPDSHWRCAVPRCPGSKPTIDTAEETT